MATTALYYPYINPPPDTWTVRSALYWERIESIIPRGVELADTTKALIDEGLLTPVDWMNVASVGDEIADDFVSYIRGIAAQRRPQKDWLPRIDSSLIHTMKMPWQITNALQETGLGSRRSSCWWAVRPDIASTYMSTLAWALASKNRNGCDLLTDRGAALDSFRLKPSELRPTGRLATGKGREALATVLKDLFLVPKTWLPPHQIRLFKERFGPELLAFRDHINNQVLSLMSESNSVDFEERLIAARNDLVTQTASLEQQLKPSKLELVRKTILPSVVGVSSFLMTQDFRIAAGLPVLLLAGEALAASVMQAPDRRKIISTHPMAYAALFNDAARRSDRGSHLRLIG